MAQVNDLETVQTQQMPLRLIARRMAGVKARKRSVMCMKEAPF